MFLTAIYRYAILCICLVVSVLWNAGAIASTQTPQTLDKIVAIVNDQVIPQSKLDQEIAFETETAKANGSTLSASEIRQHALNNLIDFDVQLQTAKLAHIEVSETQLNAALDDIAKQHGITRQQLPAALASQHMDYDTFKNQLKDKLLIQNLQQQQLAGTIKLDPKQVQVLAEKLAKQKPATVTEYHLLDLMLPVSANPSQKEVADTQQKLNEVAAALNTGQDFASVAQKMSADPQRVDLGWRSLDNMPQAFSQVATTLKDGQISQPLRAPNGVHLLQLLSTRQANQTTAINNTQITETHVRHILIKTDTLTPSSTVERRLLSIREKLVHGADFAKMAEENSQDPGSVSQGGDIGWVKPGMLDPKFEKAMNALPVNEISMPVQSQFGWHLVQVLGRKKVNDPKEALTLQAQQILFEQKMAVAIKDFISQLRAQSYIKIISN